MKLDPDRDWPRWVSRTASVGAAMLGGAVLLGWITESGALRTVHPGWPAMVPLTAVCFILSGVALWVLTAETPPVLSAVRCWAGRLTAAIPALIGVGRLCAYATGYAWPWDLLGLAPLVDAHGAVVRSAMSPATSLCFFFVGSALLVASRRKFVLASEIVALLPTPVALLGVGQFLFGGAPLLPFAQMAIHTSLGLLLLAAGVICVRADGGLVALLQGRGSGSMLARRLVPVVLLVPLATAWLRMEAQKAGWFGPEAGLSLLALVNVILFGIFTWWVAIFLNRSDLGRQTVEQELRLSRGEVGDLRAALDEHAIVAITDPAGRIVFVNDKFCAISGYSRAELLGQDHRMLNSGYHSKEFIQELWSTIRQGKTWQGDLRNRAKDGSIYWVATTIVPFFDGRGKPRQFVAIRADITARKQAEEALRHQRGRLESIIESTHVGTWEWNVQTGETAFDERWAQIVGYALAELSPVSISTWTALVHAEDLEESTRQLARHFSGEIAYYDCECRMRHKDGSWVWVHDRGRVITRTPDGKPLLMFGTHSDITARKRAEFTLREQERFLAALVGNLPGMVYRCLYDPQWTMEFVSDGCLDVTGYSRRELERNAVRSYGELVHPEDRDWLRAKYQASLEAHTPCSNEYRIVKRSGEVCWVWERAAGLYSPDGKLIAIEGFVTDVTSRRWAEAAVRDSEARFRAVLETVGLIGLMLDREGNVTLCSDFLLTMTEWTREEVIGENWFSRFLPADVREHVYRDVFLKSLPTGDLPRHFQNEIVTRAGERRLVAWSNTLLRDQTGAVIGVASIGEDITDRARAERELRASRDKLSAIFDTMSEGVALNEIVRDETGEMIDYRVLEVNRAFYDTADCHGRVAPGVLATELYGMSRETIRAFWLERRDRTDVAHSEFLSPIKGRWFHVSTSPFRNDRFVTSFFDITARKQAEAALRETQDRFREIAENIREVFWVYDVTKQAMEFVSPAYDVIWGCPWREVQGKPDGWLLAVHPEDRERCAATRAAQLARGSYRETYRIVRPDGGVRWILDQGYPVRGDGGRLVRVVGTAEDVTETHELEQRLRQSQKLEAIGTLAGGIAHDFNNILSGISGFTSLARSRAEGDREMLEYLGEISHASARAADLVRQILAFSRQGSEALVPIQLRHVVGESLRLLRASIPATIQFHVDLPGDLPAVLGNASQVHQVVMNLGTNAWHAMRERGGSLTISLRKTELGLDRQNGGLVGRFVRLDVSDTGCGMDAATRERIFEPFFTTKGPGEGTGLGLSVVHGIMQSHRGAIEVESAPGVGTSFHLYFPAVQERAIESEDVEAPLPRGRGERVLVVDDEEPLAKLGVKTLAQLGYAAEWKSDPVAALELVRAAPDRFDLVVTDQTMPGLTGIRLAEQMLQIRPQLPILLVSGFGAELTAERIAGSGVREFLPKPMTLTMLARAIRRVLDQNGNTDSPQRPPHRG